MNWYDLNGYFPKSFLLIWFQKNKVKSTFFQKILILILFFGITKFSLAQEVNLDQDIEIEESKILRHKVALILGHTHVPSGFSNGEKKMLVVPSWGFDYNYLLNEKWAIGLHSDFFTESYTVIDFAGKEEFVRERPITSAIVGSYNPHEKWSFIAGAGYEFAKEENLSIIRLGIERGWELPKKWEFIATLQYDLRLEVFNSWMLGLGINKSL